MRYVGGATTSARSCSWSIERAEMLRVGGGGVKVDEPARIRDRRVCSRDDAVRSHLHKSQGI